jgi:putative membrane protein
MYSKLAVAVLASTTIAFGASAQSTTPTPRPTEPSSPRPGQTQPQPGASQPRTGDKQARGTSGQSASATDTTFVMKAAEGGKKEVDAGKLASSKASNSDVKSFAQHMVKDHTKANSELMSLAKSKQLDAKGKEDAAKDAIAMLGKQAGAAFDRAYMDEMVKDHQMTVELFEKQSQGGDDPELKAWAGKQLPNLREHLKMAQDLQTKLGSTSSK